jgi:Acyl-CoA carboxylase epsilon subunit
MTENTPPGQQNSDSQRAETEQPPQVPVQVVRGNASPEELSALIAVVAVLSTQGGGEFEDAEGRSDHRRPESGTSSRSRWSSATRMVRETHSRGSGGWRASAFPRAEVSAHPAG